jgi:hypothetical protein
MTTETKVPTFMTYGPAQRLFEACVAARGYVERCGVGLEEDKKIAEALDKAIADAKQAITDRERFEGQIDAAREVCDDDLEIDDDPVTSEADGGVWVSAWIWVRNDEEN